VVVWQGKSAGLRRFLKGWSANLGRDKRKEKEVILRQIQELDGRADSSGLSEEDWALRYHMEEVIIQFY
jgi:hypothetical protein